MTLQNHLLNTFTNKNSLVEIIPLAQDFLAKQGVASPRREAEELVAHIWKIEWIDLYLDPRRKFNKEERHQFLTLLERRAKREPLAYITGKVSFADLVLEVSSDVLVPRPETEILVEKISETLKTLDTKDKILWDVCCGSGCIGLALKKRFPDLTVILSDISEKALVMAQKNALHNRVEVQFKQGDLLTPFIGEKCDFFTCNPPYIAEGELETLSPEVIGFEPKKALLAGPTGLEYYERLAQELSLEERGWLELGHGQGAAIQSLFQGAGWHCEFELDWAGQDRFLYLYTTDFKSRKC